MSPFTCPRCHRTSHNPTDATEGYCGACHDWTTSHPGALTLPAIEDQRRGSTRIAPGIWTDRQGALHVSVPELLELFGWPDDATHRELVHAVVREVMAEQAPDAEIIEQE